MQPVIKNYWSHSSLAGMIVQLHPSVFIRQGASFFQTGLGQGEGTDEKQREDEEKYFFHRSSFYRMFFFDRIIRPLLCMGAGRTA
jgi:hypothetical protein